MAHILVIQANSYGRPCAWGLVNDPALGRDEAKRRARGEAIRQWHSHAPCYPGERRGKMTAYDLDLPAPAYLQDIGVEQWEDTAEAAEAAGGARPDRA